MYRAQIQESVNLTASDSPYNVQQIDIKYFREYAVQINVTAAADTSGPPTVKLQGSVDGSNWSDLSGTSNNITGTGTILINRIDDGFRYVRAQVNLSGTDDITLDVWVSGREQRV